MKISEQSVVWKPRGKWHLLEPRKQEIIVCFLDKNYNDLALRKQDTNPEGLKTICHWRQWYAAEEGKEEGEEQDSWRFLSTCGSGKMISHLSMKHATTTLWGKHCYCAHFTNEGKLGWDSKPPSPCRINCDSSPTTQPLPCYVIADRMRPVFSVTDSQTVSLPALAFCDSIYSKRFLSATTAAPGAR